MGKRQLLIQASEGTSVESSDSLRWAEVGGGLASPMHNVLFGQVEFLATEQADTSKHLSRWGLCWWVGHFFGSNCLGTRV